MKKATPEYIDIHYRTLSRYRSLAKFRYIAFKHIHNKIKKAYQIYLYNEYYKDVDISCDKPTKVSWNPELESVKIYV